VVLSAPDEPSLVRLCPRRAAAGLRAIPFREPDFGGALTAVALEPRATGSSRTSHSLSLREGR
jgi:hypothetical protein